MTHQLLDSPRNFTTDWRWGGADAPDGGDLGGGGASQPGEAVEATGEELPRVLAHHPDAETVEQPTEPSPPRPLDGVHQVLRRLRREAGRRVSWAGVRR